MAGGQLDLAAVNSVLAEFNDPETGRSVLEQNQVRDVELANDRLSLTLALTTWAAPIWEPVQQSLQTLLRQRFPQLTEVTLRRDLHHRPPEPLGEIGLTAKSVIAVGSGKGGVGKSTIAASLAIGLQRAGAQSG